jgi:phospholipid transport system substrate-binding protein
MSAIHVLRQTNILAGFLALIAIGALAASDARAASSAETLVQSSIDKSYAILNDGALGASEKEQRFRIFLQSVVDIRRVALFTLGPYARNATPADTKTFEDAFGDFLAAVYQRGLYNYASPKVTGSTERAADDVIVNVTATSPNGNGSPLSLAFRVRGTSSGQLVTDLQVEGAWLAITQRSDFTAYLQQHGGNLAALAMELDKRVEQLRLAQSESEIHRRER